MYFLVILAFLGRITGETFFHHYENGNFTLTCNETVANGKKETVWYESRESLHEFQVINCSNQQPNGRNKCSDKTKCRNQLSNSASRGGGVFACEQFPNTETSQACPLFTNVTHCRHYKFFIVVIINMTADKEIFETIPAKSHDNHLVQEERSNITLSCEFQMKPSGQTFLIYWIKYTETSKCLSSVQRKEHNFSYNTHCCIDEMIKERLLNYTSLDSTERHVVHNMTILNVTYSDSGTYLCVVNAWSRGKHVWKIANNLSIEVRNQAIPSSASVPLYATTGFFVGIIIISGIAWLIYKKKIKSKGKASAQLPRAQAALEIPGDECSPYAVSSSKDLQGNEVLYSLATSPYEDPNAAYCTVDNTAASGKGPGDEIQTVYAVVSQSCSCK
ncbi:uncharacterized protein LOC128844547 isoform X1 [Malaclemys terrapin pileata]|uniref:uncharacterized protein LOC128844547 isoform X1 n=1 Tax=Malaclemys terrapin pileata TaxID=2991368 RepID=UPI0023A8D6A4|nr:uncharacterized protein LOC128844547 isoform X1 [Malaclemys terrapin pileata]XP_053898336.1 uncharacterized protein LOC128844547 isoform X1 [Malaclemys terrapin pileata]XP_053898337.1 uncharacterized protein LOC128844547 isoform X1 [Malaclemys terrapin pileata]